jgi:cell division protein YceG involved in septum cleavage
MLKTLWNQYSYAIFIIILSFSLAFLLSLRENPIEEQEYISITISEGDSLWKLSNQFSEQHTLSNKEFISWVKKHNNIQGDKILAGEEIIIPVNKEVSSSTELASAAGE